MRLSLAAVLFGSLLSGCGRPCEPQPAAEPGQSKTLHAVAHGGDQQLGNSVIYLRSILRGKDWPKAMRGKDRLDVIDQKTCKYLPHAPRR
jgi:hypothetical protein